MTTPLRLALVQMNIVAGDPEANFAKMEARLDEAAALSTKPDLIVLPEMWNTGYALTEIQSLADPDGLRTKEAISAFCRKHSVSVLAGSIAQLRGDTAVTNTVHVFDRTGAVVS
jgi:omega-amidase